MGKLNDFKNHVYNIDLQISNTESSKAALKYMQDAFEESDHSIEALNKAYNKLARNTKDVTELQAQYNKLVEQYNQGIEESVKAKDTMIDKLNAEKIAIMQNKALTEGQKVYRIKIINAQIKSIKLEKKLLNSQMQALKTGKKLNMLVKDDLKTIKEKVKEQLKFVAALKTTEGRYDALKKVTKRLVKFGLKSALGVGLAGAGFAGTMLKSSFDNAEAFEAKERALGSLKSGIDPSVVDEVYIKGGGDWESIVAAVNNLSNITKDNGLLVQGAILELRNPGVGKMLLSTSKQNEGNIASLNNILAQIRKQTGAQDMSAALEASTMSSAVSKKRISQAEYLQAYAALSQAGLEEETIDRIINSVSKQKGDFITNLNNAKLDKYVHGQEKIRMQNTKLNLSKLDFEKTPEESKAARLAAKMREIELKKNEMIANFIEKLDIDALFKFFDSAMNLMSKLLPKVFDIITPVLSKLSNFLSLLLDAFSQSDGPVSFFKKMGELAAADIKKRDEELKKQNELQAMQLEALKKADASLSTVVGSAIYKMLGGDKNRTEILNKHARNFGGLANPSVIKFAQGGIATSPSICGEAGPELIIPLDYSRAGRANQIINNFNTTQSFNMQSNQTTPLAFSQVIGQNRFIRRFAGVY